MSIWVGVDVSPDADLSLSYIVITEFFSLDGSLQQPQKISYDSSHVENWDTGDHETTE
jgi:hypothetical protein